MTLHDVNQAAQAETEDAIRWAGSKAKPDQIEALRQAGPMIAVRTMRRLGMLRDIEAAETRGIIARGEAADRKHRETCARMGISH